VFTARYGLIPYMKHVTLRLLKVKPDNGAPIARKSFWISTFPLLVKQFCFEIISHRHSSSRLVWKSSRFCFKVLDRISLVSEI
jgi:hypothetical protein